MSKEKTLPNNWTDYLNEEHKSKEISNQILEKFKIFINDEIFESLQKFELIEILKKTKNYFLNKKINIKIGINKNSNLNFIEFLFITKISQRLFRIKRNDINIILDNNLNCLGDKDFFNTSDENELFIF